MTKAGTAALRVVPTGAALGADIEGLDLSADLDQSRFERIREAWAQHLVLRFRGQRLDEDGLIAFSRRFGTLDPAPINTAGTRPHRNPFVLIVSNVVEDGRPIGLADAGQDWHTDMSYNPTIGFLNVLFAVKVPRRDGRVLGNTAFVNTHAAYEDLAPKLKARLANATKW